MKSINIVDYIPHGRMNAISRNSLVTLTGLNDRAVREAISKARRDTPILNMQDGSGYYQPTEDDVDELRHFVAQETRRAKSIFWSLRSARKAVERLGG